MTSRTRKALHTALSLAAFATSAGALGADLGTSIESMVGTTWEGQAYSRGPETAAGTGIRFGTTFQLRAYFPGLNADGELVYHFKRNDHLVSPIFSAPIQWTELKVDPACKGVEPRVLHLDPQTFRQASASRWSVEGSDTAYDCKISKSGKQVVRSATVRVSQFLVDSSAADDRTLSFSWTLGDLPSILDLLKKPWLTLVEFDYSFHEVRGIENPEAWLSEYY